MSKKKPLAKPIIVTAGDKGGIGKSFAARCLAHNLIRWQVPWQGIDGDPRNSNFSHHYARVTPIDIVTQKVTEDFDRLLDQIEKLDVSCAVIVDFPAGSGDLMTGRGHRLLALAAHLERPLHRMFSLDDGLDCLKAINREGEVLGLGNVIAVLNGRFGTPEMFARWRRHLKGSTKSLRDLVLEAGGTEIYLPRLPPIPKMHIEDTRSTFHKTDEAFRDLSFNERLNYSDWLSAMEGAFAPLKEMFA